MYSIQADSIVQQENKKTNYLASLDGLRAVAILFVFIAHLGFGYIIPGGFGVTLFFFLSGFLITRLLIHEYDKKGGIDLKNFYIRRLIRLYPPLILMLIIFPIVLLSFNHPVNLEELTAVAFYWENYFLVYAQSKESYFFNIFWSLAVEEHFYLFFPLLFLLLYKKNYFIPITIALIALALFFRIYYIETLSTDKSYVATYVLTHCRYDSILYGCLASLIINSNNRFYNKLLINKAIFLLAASLLIFTFLYRDEFFRNSFRYSVQGISLMFLVPAIVLFKKYQVLNKLLSKNWIVYLGKISYSVYVMHWILIIGASSLYPENPLIHLAPTKPWLWYIIVFSGTILLSTFSYHVVERQFIALRQKFGSIAK